jgi:hypothetical protein
MTIEQRKKKLPAHGQLNPIIKNHPVYGKTNNQRLQVDIISSSTVYLLNEENLLQKAIEKIGSK